MSKVVILNTGDKMPSVGLGTWKLDNSEQITYESIKMGYKHIDCSPIYMNEPEVGKGIKKAIEEGICTRKDLWITSKLWNTNHKKEHVLEAIKMTLEALQLDYLDLYLIHFPMSFKYIDPKQQYPPDWNQKYAPNEPAIQFEDAPLQETWEAMEDLVHDGYTKNIGISNFNCQIIHDLLKYAKIKPSVNQIELHPYLVQENLVKYCTTNGIAVTAYSAFGGLGLGEPSFVPEGFKTLFDDKKIIEIAKKHQKSVAQTILRWILQRSSLLSVVPKSSSIPHLAANLDVFDFELSPEDMKTLSTLGVTIRFNDPGYFMEKFFGFFFPIHD